MDGQANEEHLFEIILNLGQYDLLSGDNQFMTFCILILALVVIFFSRMEPWICAILVDGMMRNICK